jgi:hypothetical protein
MHGSSKSADLYQGKDNYTKHGRDFVRYVKQQARKAVRRMSQAMLRKADPDNVMAPRYSCDYWS